MNTRLPVMHVPSPPPAVWRQTAPVLARGAALVLAGVAAEWLLRSAAKRALELSSPRRDDSANGKPAKLLTPLRTSHIEASETIIVRRVTIRR